MTGLIVLVSAFLILLMAVLIQAASRHLTRQKRCPICRDWHPIKIQSPAWVNPVQFRIPSQPFRCSSCGNRFIRIGRGVS